MKLKLQIDSISTVIAEQSSFLQLLSEPCRISYLPLLHDIMHSTNPFNWRLRQSLSLQLPELVLLPPIDSLYETLFPLVLTLLQDPVYIVRKESYKGVAAMINTLSIDRNNNGGEKTDNSKHIKSIVATINSLYRAETYQMRQLWADLTLCLFHNLNRDILENNFINGIIVLATDPVCNVRSSVASLLTGWDINFQPTSYILNGPTCNDTLSHSNWHWLLRRVDIQDSTRNLSQDNKDVYDIIVKLQPIYSDFEFKILSKSVIIKSEISTTIPADKDINISLTSLGTPIDIHSPNRIHSFSSDWSSAQMDGLEYSLDKIDGLPNEILERDLIESQRTHTVPTSDDDDDDYDQQQSKDNNIELTAIR